MGKEHTSGHLRQMRQCIEGMRHIESLGRVNDTTGRSEFGWSAADSYEDSRAWAQYHAGQIIGGVCTHCGFINGAHRYQCVNHPATQSALTAIDAGVAG